MTRALVLASILGTALLTGCTIKISGDAFSVTRITLSAPTVTAPNNGYCTGPYYVTLWSPSGSVSQNSVPVPVSLSGSSSSSTTQSVMFYSDSACTTQATSLTAGVGAGGIQFYARDNLAETATLRATTSAGLSATLSITYSLTLAKAEVFAGVDTRFGSTDGSGSAARFGRPRGIYYDSPRNRLFVADTENHTIRSIDTLTGVVSTLAGTASVYGGTDGTGTTASFYRPWGLAFDTTNEQLYVADNGGHTIRKIDVATGAVTTLAGSYGNSGTANGVGNVARFKNPTGIYYSAGTLYIADQGNHTIRTMNATTFSVATLLGAAGVSGTANGAAGVARFYQPSGLIVDSGTGNLYITDRGNCAIRMYDGANVSTFAGLTGTCTNGTDGVGGAARFAAPAGIAWLSATKAVLSDAAGGNTVRTLDISGASPGQVTTIAGTTTSAGMGDRDSTGSSARFNSPEGVTTDGSNKIYVTDANLNKIRLVDTTNPGPAVVTTPYGPSAAIYSLDGTGTSARFASSRAIAYWDGYLYVVDTAYYQGSTVRKISIATGEVTTLAGLAGTTGTTDGIGTAARFNTPRGACAQDGYLYVADSNHSIRRVDLSTAEVTTFAGSTTGVSGYTNGVGTAARFVGPRGLFCTPTTIYVADTYAYTIRSIDIASQNVTTLAGVGGSIGTANGVGTAARFTYPMAIHSDDTYLYIADGSCVRRLRLSDNTVDTFAGSCSSGGTTNGTGTAARFNGQTTLSGKDANLYVMDSNNGMIRLVNTSSAVVTTYLGTVSTFSDLMSTVSASTLNGAGVEGHGVWTPHGYFWVDQSSVRWIH